jgi:hypothetical protein
LNTIVGIGNDKINYICLVHIDRLSITLCCLSGSSFQNIRNPDSIPVMQNFNRITLKYDFASGINAYYHSYVVYYDGYIVGRLHSGSRLKKPELQFDFGKELFYSISASYWYDVYLAIVSELVISYNNINYLEISVDTDKDLVEQFGYLYANAVNNRMRTGDRFRMRMSTRVHVMNNGSSFVIEGIDNEIAIYNKSQHAEDYILKFFANNGLEDQSVFRIESRLTWNYLRYLRNKRRLNINIETLLDSQKLVALFNISIACKIEFKDQESKRRDRHGNPDDETVSIIDDLPLQSATIGRLNDQLHTSHYKTDTVDLSILRQSYYRYIETGNQQYLRILKASGAIAGYNMLQILGLINKFNSKYKGNLSQTIVQRMEYAQRKFAGKSFVMVCKQIFSFVAKRTFSNIRI